MVKSPGAGWQNIVLRPMRLSPVLTRGNCLCAAHWRLAQATHAWPGGELHSAASPHLAAAGFRPSQLLCRSLASASVAQQADALPAVAALGPARARPAAYGQPACDYTLLAACVRELQERWIPAKVDQAVLGSPTTLYLRLRSGAAAPAPPSTPPHAAPGAVAALVATVQPASKSGKLKKKDFLAGRAPPAAEEQAAASWDVGPPERAAPATPLPEFASGWLALSWHTWAARICVGSAPSRGDAAEAFSFGAQVRICKSAHQQVTSQSAHPMVWSASGAAAAARPGAAEGGAAAGLGARVPAGLWTAAGQGALPPHLPGSAGQARFFGIFLPLSLFAHA